MIAASTLDLKSLAEMEARHLKTICTTDELASIKFSEIDGYSMDNKCLYGQITGDPDSYRAIELICDSTEYVICNDVIDDGKIESITELIKFKEVYFNESNITLKFVDRLVDYSGPKVIEDGLEDIMEVVTENLIINPNQRTMHYLSPLELYIPGLQDEHRNEKLLELAEWLQ